MRYLPATAIALAVGAAVCYALYLTQGNVWCLLGLFALGAAVEATPQDPEVAKAKYAAETAKNEALFNPESRH